MGSQKSDLLPYRECPVLWGSPPPSRRQLAPCTVSQNWVRGLPVLQTPRGCLRKTETSGPYSGATESTTLGMGPGNRHLNSFPSDMRSTNARHPLS